MNQHNLANHTCEIDGETAYCETYVVGTMLSHDGLTCTIAAGRYMDQLEKQGSSRDKPPIKPIDGSIGSGDPA